MVGFAVDTDTGTGAGAGAGAGDGAVVAVCFAAEFCRFTALLAAVGLADTGADAVDWVAGPLAGAGAGAGATASA